LIVLNADDEKVMGHYKEFIWPDHKVEKFSSVNFQFSKFDPEKLLWLVKNEALGEIEINLLGEYALADINAAINIAKNLEMSGEEIKKGIANIKPVEHRLQPIKSGQGILVIDDSYNGNPDGAREAIKVLSRFTNRRKIYITPGLVEMGKSAPNVHREIGRQLAGVADVVVLIKNSLTPFIEEGMGETDKIVWFNTAQEAHAALKGILKPNDVILFQNDWGDQYL
jgi:UDP-N-acetylmuramoyl-tripeptide--D-alanyl-D-alanine ligase